jgi:hypothetical protein
LPYGGTTPEQDVKIEHCVASVMAKDPSLDKVSAIRICKSQVLRGGKKNRRKRLA